jgi:hypothetical protein
MLFNNQLIKMRPFLILLFPLLAYFAGSSQSDLAAGYLDQYQEIAVIEMHRTGIPASIKLAQGLLESNWGRSELAVKSNNHFGIKCSGNWEGDTHYRYDDDYDEQGKKMKSCFREYEHAEESFADHSRFLTDPAKSARYGFLFEYPADDYVSWAHGLKKAGYATDPKYAEKLITIIEKYDLHQYDLHQFPDEAIAELPESGYSVQYINNCKVVRARGGEKLPDLADEVGISYRKLLKYNPEILNKSQRLDLGQRVYLEDKKQYYLGEEKYHEVGPGEDIASISNRYGIDPNYLKELNKPDHHETWTAGDRILLTRNADNKPVRQESRQKEYSADLAADHSEYLFDQALTPLKN